MQSNAVRVLVVDDNEVVRHALTGIVRSDEKLLVVGEAWTGEMALEAVVKLDPHVVCLDVLMPEMDGLTVLQHLRAEHASVRVVIITGEATSDVLKQALALGAHGFVVKPFNAGKVLDAIHAAVRAPAPLALKDRPEEGAKSGEP